MARTPAFDREQALAAALKLFWRRGYTATSLTELLQVMAISRSSFYASFGDKQALYAECLTRFAARTRAMIRPGAGPHPAAAAVHNFFEESLFRAPPRRVARGCMMVNTLLELADVEPALQQTAQQGLEQVRQTFEDLFAEAGEPSVAFSPRELSEQVMTLNLGLRVQSRMEQDSARLRTIANRNLALLGLTA